MDFNLSQNVWNSISSTLDCYHHQQYYMQCCLHCVTVFIWLCCQLCWWCLPNRIKGFIDSSPAHISEVSLTSNINYQSHVIKERVIFSLLQVIVWCWHYDDIISKLREGFKKIKTNLKFPIGGSQPPTHHLMDHLNFFLPQKCFFISFLHGKFHWLFLQNLPWDRSQENRPLSSWHQPPLLLSTIWSYRSSTFRTFSRPVTTSRFSNGTLDWWQFWRFVKHFRDTSMLPLNPILSKYFWTSMLWLNYNSENKGEFSITPETFLNSTKTTLTCLPQSPGETINCMWLIVQVQKTIFCKPTPYGKRNWSYIRDVKWLIGWL